MIRELRAIINNPLFSEINSQLRDNQLKIARIDRDKKLQNQMRQEKKAQEREQCRQEKELALIEAQLDAEYKAQFENDLPLMQMLEDIASQNDMLFDDEPPSKKQKA